jgi:hypothetical protein
VTPAQDGVNGSRNETVEPRGASCVAGSIWLPRAMSTAPPGGIATPPAACCTDETVAERSAFGAVAGNDEKVSTSIGPDSGGVVGPQAPV